LSTNTWTGPLSGAAAGLSSGNVTFGGTTYSGYSFGANSFPPRINGITAAGNYPPVPATGYGYAAIDVGPALFTAPPPVVVGTSSRSIMGINSAIATAFPDNFNVFAINGQLATPSSYAGNQWAWYGMYHESDHNGSGTLHFSDGVFGATYNGGNGVCTTCVGGHFEAIGNFYGGTNTPLTAYNAGLECNSGVLANATHTNDYCFHVMTPATGGIFTNGHTGILVDDQSAAGVVSAYGIRLSPSSSTTPSGYIALDLGTNTMTVESQGSGAVSITAPTGTLGNVGMTWPTVHGFITTSPCSGGKVFLSSDFTSANASGLQAITGLNCTFPSSVPAAYNASFRCSLIYSQATNVSGDQFGVGWSNTITNFNAWGRVATNTGAAAPFATGAATGIATNTPAAVVTFQPANTGLNIAEIDGTAETTSGGTFQLYVTNGTAANAIVVKRDSYCQFF